MMRARMMRAIDAVRAFSAPLSGGIEPPRMPTTAVKNSSIMLS
jgi:hypothetical protein